MTEKLLCTLQSMYLAQKILTIPTAIPINMHKACTKIVGIQLVSIIMSRRLALRSVIVWKVQHRTHQQLPWYQMGIWKNSMSTPCFWKAPHVFIQIHFEHAAHICMQAEWGPLNICEHFVYVLKMQMAGGPRMWCGLIKHRHT